MELHGFNINRDGFVCIEEIKWNPVPGNILIFMYCIL